MDRGSRRAALALAWLLLAGAPAALAEHIAGLPVDAPSLAVRTGPGPRFPEAGRVEERASVQVILTEDRWRLVRLGDGSTGWVQGEYVRPGAAPQVVASQVVASQVVASQAEPPPLRETATPRAPVRRDVAMREERRGAAESRGVYPLASCSSWDGTVTQIGGLGTSAATMSGTVRGSDALEYCERDPARVMRRDAGRADVRQCVDSVLRRTRGMWFAAQANCERHELETVRGRELGVFHLVPVRGQTLWRSLNSKIVHEKTCAEGTPPLYRQFAMLCPAQAAAMGLSPERAVAEAPPAPPAEGATADLAPILGRWSPVEADCGDGDARSIGIERGRFSSWEVVCRVTKASRAGATFALARECEHFDDRWTDSIDVETVSGSELKIGDDRYKLCKRGS